MSKEIIKVLVERIDFLSAQQRAAAAAGNVMDVELCENRLFMVRAMLKAIYDHQKIYGPNKMNAWLRRIFFWYQGLLHLPLRKWRHAA